MVLLIRKRECDRPVTVAWQIFPSVQRYDRSRAVIERLIKGRLRTLGTIERLGMQGSQRSQG